jgi:hypothetical protein
MTGSSRGMLLNPKTSGKKLDFPEPIISERA